MKCNPEDTIGDLKKLIAAQTGTKYDKIILKKWYTIFKDQIKLSDCKFSSQMFNFLEISNFIFFYISRNVDIFVCSNVLTLEIFQSPNIRILFKMGTNIFPFALVLCSVCVAIILMKTIPITRWTYTMMIR